MPKADNGGVKIEYDTIGHAADPALLLIMGFTAQMTAWEAGFCEMLAGKGFHVIRFDNRDCGLSDKSEGPQPDLMTLLASVQSGQGVTVDVPYTLSEMAADGLAVLDDLGIAAAHIAGASMGGMIAQQMAIEHPDRVLSLTSIMSSTGNSQVGQADPEAMAALMTPPPVDREGAIERGVSLGRVISGPLFDEDRSRLRAAEAYDRSFHPAGAPFQMAAIAKTGDRTEGLGTVTAPTLVIHGRADSLIAVSGGEATAKAVAGAKLLVIDDMGHDVPQPRWPEITGAMAEVAGLA